MIFSKLSINKHAPDQPRPRWPQGRLTYVLTKLNTFQKTTIGFHIYTGLYGCLCQMIPMSA